MKFVYFLAYALIRILGVMPFRLLYTLGYLLGVVYWMVSKRDRTIAITNIQRCFPELSETEQIARARASLIHTAINVMETCWVWAHRYPDIRKKIRTIEGHEILEKAEAAPTGTVFLVSHFGQWDMFGDYFGQYCKDPVYLGRSFGIPILDNYIKKSRERSGGTIYPITRDGLNQLYNATENGHATGLLPDQQPDRKHGIFSPLFNIDALTSLLIQDIIQQTGARVVVVCATRRPRGGGFDVHFFEPDEDIYSKDIQRSTRALNKAIEDIIAHAPEQYTWNYKRFKFRPDEDEKFYP